MHYPGSSHTVLRIGTAGIVFVLDCPASLALDSRALPWVAKELVLFSREPSPEEGCKEKRVHQHIVVCVERPGHGGAVSAHPRQRCEGLEAKQLVGVGIISLGRQGDRHDLRKDQWPTHTHTQKTLNRSQSVSKNSVNKIAYYSFVMSLSSRVFMPRPARSAKECFV